MLLNIWNNAPSTATFYVCCIALLYFAGLFCLLIHSIRQRTDQVTYYDVYMELCDVFHYIGSIFQKNKKKSPNEYLRKSNDSNHNPVSLPTNCVGIGTGKIYDKLKKNINVIVFVDFTSFDLKKYDFYNSEEENDETNEVITHRLNKMKKLNHREKNHMSENNGIRSAVLWSKSNGKESITVICQTDADSVAI